jgi:hypothetical protein
MITCFHNVDRNHFEVTNLEFVNFNNNLKNRQWQEQRVLITKKPDHFFFRSYGVAKKRLYNKHKKLYHQPIFKI